MRETVPFSNAREQAISEHLMPDLRSFALTNSGCGFQPAYGPVDRLRMGNELEEQLELCRTSWAPFGDWLGCWNADDGPVIYISQFEMNVAGIVHEIHVGFNEGLCGLARDVRSENEDTLCPAHPQMIQPSKELANRRTRHIGSLRCNQDLESPARSRDLKFPVVSRVNPPF